MSDIATIVSSRAWDQIAGEDIPDIEPQDDEGEEHAELTPFVRRVALVAGLDSFLFGLDTGIISAVLVTIGNGLGGQPLTIGQEEIIVTAATLGALIGSLIAGPISDWWGRRKTIFLASILLALGSIEQAAAQVFKEVVVGRVIIGLGIGLASMICPVYFSELSPAKYRGRVVTMLVILITGGQVVAYIIGAAFYRVDQGWRWMLLSGAFPAIVQLLLSFTLPESPRYSVKKGNLEDAHETLTRVYPHLTSSEIQKKVETIEKILKRETDEILHVNLNTVKSPSRSSGLVDALWRDLPTRRALIVACGLQGFQQATGFNTLMYYSGKILLSAGFSHPAFSAIFIALANWICTMISFRLIDQVGRRVILLRTLLGMIAGLFVTGFCFIFIHLAQPVGEGTPPSEPPHAGVWAYFALLGMIGFCCSYALGIGNVPWIVVSLSFSTNRIMSIGNSFSTATNWTTNLIVAGTFLHLTDVLTPVGAFWIYSFIGILAWVFTWRLVPETRGLTIEECRRLFEHWSPGLAQQENGRPEGSTRYQVLEDPENETTVDTEDSALVTSQDVASQSR